MFKKIFSFAVSCVLFLNFSQSLAKTATILVVPRDKITCTESPTLCLKKGEKVETKEPEIVKTYKNNIIFEENFDDQPDWTSKYINMRWIFYTDQENLPIPDRYKGNIPDDWFLMWSTSQWGPSGFIHSQDNHETIEILSSNSEKAIWNLWKSFVIWREAQTSMDTSWISEDGIAEYGWISEGTLTKFIPEWKKELFITFYVSFSDKWTTNFSTASNLLKVYNWGDELDPSWNAWPQFKHSYGFSKKYWVQNVLSFRWGEYYSKYKRSNFDMKSMLINSFWINTFKWFPEPLLGLWDVSLDFVNNTKWMWINWSDPKISDLINGWYIINDSDWIISHNQIYGWSSNWTKMTFYLKMNSSPWVADWELKEWLNDELILQNKNIPWVWELDEGSSMPKWNAIDFWWRSYFPTIENKDNNYWLNKYYKRLPKEELLKNNNNKFDVSTISLYDRYEEWYSIDDIVIYEPITSSNNMWESSPKDGRLPLDYTVWWYKLLKKPANNTSLLNKEKYVSNNEIINKLWDKIDKLTKKRKKQMKNSILTNRNKLLRQLDIYIETVKGDLKPIIKRRKIKILKRNIINGFKDIIKEIKK